jgi:hypothetical protein
MIRPSHVHIRREAAADIAADSRQGQRALARCDGALVVTQIEEILGYRGGEPPRSMGIVQGRGQGDGLAQEIQDPSAIAEYRERAAQVEPQINGLLAGVTTLGEVLEGFQRLLEGRQRLTICRSAGMVSWSVSSRVSTCPVTLARMVRASSCSSMWL